MLFCNIIAERAVVNICLFQECENALLERRQIRTLHLEQGHRLELNTLLVVEILWMKGQHEQLCIVLDEIKQSRLAKIARLGADNKEAACYAAYVHDR